MESKAINEGISTLCDIVTSLRDENKAQQALIEELVGALETLMKKYWCNKGEPYLDKKNKRMKLSEFISCITPEGIPDYWKKADKAVNKAKACEGKQKEGE